MQITLPTQHGDDIKKKSWRCIRIRILILTAPQGSERLFFRIPASPPAPCEPVRDDMVLRLAPSVERSKLFLPAAKVK